MYLSICFSFILFLQRIRELTTAPLPVDLSLALLVAIQSDNKSSIEQIHGDPAIYFEDLYTLYDQRSSATNTQLVEIAMDSASNTIYAADERDHRLASGSYDSISRYWNIIRAVPVSDQVGGIAVDEVSENIYWVDTKYKRIGVASVSTSRIYWTILIDTDINNPIDLAIYSPKSYLFWIDNGNNSKRIERSDLAGTKRRVLVLSNTKLGPLTVDNMRERLFYVEGNTMVCCTFEGAEVTRFNLDLSGISGLSMHKDILFISYYNRRIITMISVEDINSPLYKNLSLRTDNVTHVTSIDFYVRNGKYPSAESPCKTDSCSQICLPGTSTSAVCKCMPGYSIHSDGVTCKTDPPLQEDMLFAVDHEQNIIYQLGLTDGKIQVVVARTEQHSEIVAVCYDEINQDLYWIDNGLGTIHRMSLLESIDRVLYTDTSPYYDLEQFVGITLDNETMIIYYCDKARGRIWAIDQRNENKRQLIWEDSTSRPSAIVADPVNKFIYWADSGVIPGIKRLNSTTVNYNSWVLITSDIESPPEDLCLDFINEVMYWADPARGEIKQATLLGEDIRVFYKGPASYYRITLDSLYLYVIDRYHSTYIQRIRRDDGIISTQAPHTLFVNVSYLHYYSAIDVELRTRFLKTQTTGSVTVFHNVSKDQGIYMAVYVAVPILVLIMLIVFLVLCLYYRCRKKSANDDHVRHDYNNLYESPYSDPSYNRIQETNREEKETEINSKIKENDSEKDTTDQTAYDKVYYSP